jgi:hypothetical protein
MLGLVKAAEVSIMNTLFLYLFFFPLAAAILGLLVASLVWVYRDAEARSKPGALVVLLVLLLDWPLSLLLWLVFRPDTP